MFNITSHFDISRDYNPQTGEELNIIVENTTDRPWYQREYFRVDWSKNLVTDALRRSTRFARSASSAASSWRPEAYYVAGSRRSRTRRSSTTTTATST